MENLNLEMLTSIVSHFEAADPEEQKQILKELTNNLLNMVEIPADIREKLFDVISYFTSILADADA